MREVTVQTCLYLDCIKYPDGVSEHIEIVASIEAANGNIFPTCLKLLQIRPFLCKCVTQHHLSVCIHSWTNNRQKATRNGVQIQSNYYLECAYSTEHPLTENVPSAAFIEQK